MARAGAAGTVVVAVSGGPDSLSLLYALHHLREELGLRLHGAHLDHGIRGPDSSADAEFVGETFRQLGIQGTLRKVDVPSYAERQRLSMEEAARELRLDFLAEVALRQRAWGVALGHTSDDQAETVLMRILRGAGTRGLRGMRPLAVRAVPGGEVVLLRPMLSVTREETEAYCREMGLRPRRDESNLSPKMTRNRVRMELLPLMERYNPAVREALLRLSRSAAEDADYVDAAAGPLWDELARRDGPGISLDRQGISGLHAAMAATLLRRAVLEVKGDLRDVTRRHVDAMMRLLAGPAGRSLDLPAGLSFSVGYSRATLLPEGGRSDSPAAPGRPPRDRRPRRDRAGGLDGHGPRPRRRASLKPGRGSGRSPRPGAHRLPGPRRRRLAALGAPAPGRRPLPSPGHAPVQEAPGLHGRLQDTPLLAGPRTPAGRPQGHSLGRRLEDRGVGKDARRRPAPPPGPLPPHLDALSVSRLGYPDHLGAALVEGRPMVVPE